MNQDQINTRETWSHAPPPTGAFQRDFLWHRRGPRTVEVGHCTLIHTRRWTHLQLVAFCVMPTEVDMNLPRPFSLMRWQRVGCDGYTSSHCFARSDMQSIA